jgi:hypothetical protein
MRDFHRFAAVSLCLAVSLATLAAPSSAFAADPADNGPCGNFDFSAGLSCKVEVSGGCTAGCTPFKFEVACGGKCTATATQQCTGSCGAQCIAQCDPKYMDCFAGCHTECDEPTTKQCQAKHPNEDCVTQARAQCDTRCKESCKVPTNSCQEHCNACCTGSCTTQVNFDCDFACRAELRGSCRVQCQKPDGAIFCNGQYVNASDVKACLAYLATRGINVDASAAGSGSCGPDGCVGTGSAKVSGCAFAPAEADAAVGSLAAICLALAARLARARRRRGQRDRSSSR